MNTLRNRVSLIGRLGNDPEVKTFDNNRKLAKFSLATNDVYKNKNGEKQEETQWHNIVIWGNLANVVENYLSKGKEVVIEGKLNYRSYEDKTGNKHYITEIIGQEMLIISPK